jgi:hypothetical protein
MGGLAQPGCARENGSYSVAPRGNTHLFQEKFCFLQGPFPSPAFGDRPLPPLGTMAPCPTVRDRGNLCSNIDLPLLVTHLVQWQLVASRSLLLFPLFKFMSIVTQAP